MIPFLDAINISIASRCRLVLEDYNMACDDVSISFLYVATPTWLPQLSYQHIHALTMKVQLLALTLPSFRGITLWWTEKTTKLDLYTISS